MNSLFEEHGPGFHPESHSSCLEEQVLQDQEEKPPRQFPLTVFRPLVGLKRQGNQGSRTQRIRRLLRVNMKDRMELSYHHTLLLNREQIMADPGQAQAYCRGLLTAGIHVLGKTASPLNPLLGHRHHVCHTGPMSSAKGLTWHLAALPQSLPRLRAQERMQPV